jgi:hypothetical protein
MPIVVGIPPVIVSLVQQGLLERAFHDGLFPGLMYRSEAQFEEWPANTGTEVFMSRPGLMAPVVTPLLPGVDPVPATVNYEQWVARLERFANTIDTHVPTSAVANSDLFLRNIHQLGLNAGQSLNRIPRNALFTAYLSGHTVTLQAELAGAPTIRVAALNGFTDVIVPGTNARPQPVSPANPLAITVGGQAQTVVGVVPDDATDPLGPGTITLGAVLAAPVAARDPVLAADRPQIIRSGGGASVDAIGAGDTFVLQDLINAVNRLRRNNVPPHEDGYYHAHFNTDANSQVFIDPAFQRLNTALPNGSYYQEAFIGTISGAMGVLNTESPDFLNSGARTATGAAAFYSRDIHAETTNEGGINIGRILVTGRGGLYERGLDESAYVTEAGLTGKQGEFQVVNAGIEVKTERVRLILRAPLNRLQDQVAATWSITTSFPVPSDVSSGGPERFKRAIVIEHALD